MAGYIGKSQGVTQVDGYTRDEADAEHTGTQTFNRTSTDGSIVTLQKDGTTVGSIGTGSGTMYIGSGTNGLKFDSGIIRSWNPTTNAIVSDARDIGASDSRFKDLYLSGGVYLGGTSYPNHLDDYEEGSTSNTFYDSSGNVLTAGVHYTVQRDYYTKIGNMVFLTIGVRDIRGTKGDIAFNPPFAGISDRWIGNTLGGEQIVYACCGANAGRIVFNSTAEYKYGMAMYRVA